MWYINRILKGNDGYEYKRALEGFMQDEVTKYIIY